MLTTHSQAGYFSWLIADARPKLVKGNIAIEPPGPPIENVLFAAGKGRAWGLTNIPITYDPPLTDPSDLAVVKEDKADGPDLSICWMQKSPARQLVNLTGIPTILLVGGQGFHQHHQTRSPQHRGSRRPGDYELSERRPRSGGHGLQHREAARLPKRRYVDRKQRRFRGVGECRRSITAPASQTGGGPRAFEVDLPGGLTIGCLHLCSDYLSRGPAARRQELCAARAGGRRAIAVCSGDQFDTGPVEPRGIQRHFERSGDALGPRPSTHPNGPPFTGLKRCGFTM